MISGKATAADVSVNSQKEVTVVIQKIYPSVSAADISVALTVNVSTIDRSLSFKFVCKRLIRNLLWQYFLRLKLLRQY